MSNISKPFGWRFENDEIAAALEHNVYIRKMIIIIMFYVCRKILEWEKQWRKTMSMTRRWFVCVYVCGHNNHPNKENVCSETKEWFTEFYLMNDSNDDDDYNEN